MNYVSLDRVTANYVSVNAASPPLINASPNAVRHTQNHCLFSRLPKYASTNHISPNHISWNFDSPNSLSLDLLTANYLQMRPVRPTPNNPLPNTVMPMPDCFAE